MQRIQSLRYRALRRVQRFLAELKLGAGTQLATLVARFLAALALVEHHMQVQDEADAEAHLLTGQVEEQLRSLLADWVRPIVHGAEVLYGPRSVEMRGFRMPPAHGSLEKVLTAAETIAESATAVEARLVEHGLETDFAAQLRASVSAIRETADRRDRARERRTAATEGIRRSQAEARTLVKLLNTLLTRQLRDDPTRLDEWRAAIRVADVPGPRHGKSAPAEAPEVVAAAAPVVAPEPVAPPAGEVTA